MFKDQNNLNKHGILTVINVIVFKKKLRSCKMEANINNIIFHMGDGLHLFQIFFILVLVKTPQTFRLTVLQTM